MKKRSVNAKTRIMTLLLAISLLLGLTACGKEKTDDSSVRTVYVPQTVDFTAGLETINYCCLIDETVYLLGDEIKHSSQPSQILRLPLTGGEAEPLPDYEPARIESSPWILEDGSTMERSIRYMPSTLRAGPDGTLWVTENPQNVEYGKLPGRTIPDNGSKGGRFDEAYILRQLDTDGKELQCFSARVSELEAYVNMGEVYGLLGDGDGQIWIWCKRGLAALTDSGKIDFTLPVNQGGVIFLGDGRMAVSSSFTNNMNENYIHLQVVNKEKQGWGETFILPYNAWIVRDGNESALFYYKTFDTLCAWNQELGEGEQIVNTVEVGIEEDACPLLTRLEDGRVVVACGSGFFDASDMTLLVLTPAEGKQERKVLNFATFWLSNEMRKAIIQFNLTNPDYHIVVTDYTQYGGQKDAMTRLATEIGAGKIPDLLNMGTDVPVSRWAANGILEDLWPWIDGDRELSRDDLMERVLEAAEINGKLYEVSQYFQIWTLTGPRSVVGDRMTWTMDDMWEALEKMPEGCVPVPMGRYNMLGNLINLYGSRFVDWETGECHFDSEEFKSLLESCVRLPEDAITWGQARDEKEIMLLGLGFDGFFFPQEARFLLRDEISYVGYPNPWGKVGSSFLLMDNVGMFSACKYKEGAWAFLRTLILPGITPEQDEDASKGGYFPVNKTDFQARTERLMTPEYEMDENGNKVEKARIRHQYDLFPEEILQIYSVSQEDYDQIMALYNSIDTVARWDRDLLSIIYEVAGSYFAGDRSLDDAAALIQNRASLYVNESR